MRRCPLSRNPDLGVYGDRSVVGTGSGRIAVYPEIIPGQKSSCRRSHHLGNVNALVLLKLEHFNSGDVKGTIPEAVRYHFVSNDVRRHRLISISYISLLPCHGRGREFESRRPRHSFQKSCPDFSETKEGVTCPDFRSRDDTRLPKDGKLGKRDRTRFPLSHSSGDYCGSQSSTNLSLCLD
jgi:hypothetical protein